MLIYLNTYFILPDYNLLQGCYPLTKELVIIYQNFKFVL